MQSGNIYQTLCSHIDDYDKLYIQYFSVSAPYPIIKLNLNCTQTNINAVFSVDRGRLAKYPDVIVNNTDRMSLELTYNNMKDLGPGFKPYL